MTNKTTNSFIQVNDIVLRFKKDILLDHVSYQCEQGKIHGIVGRNGSGKTLLMKCICGFIPVTSGKVTVFGKVIGKDVDIPDNIGAIIETPGFLPEYGAYRNLKFLADITGRASKEKIRNAMQSVGLDPDSKKYVGKFSLGMRQRLGLAQAIMEDPDLLILDDLGTEYISQLTISVLYELINTRMLCHRPTIYTSNIVDSSIFEARYTEKVASRILGSCQIFKFFGTDQRLKRGGKR